MITSRKVVARYLSAASVRVPKEPNDLSPSEKKKRDEAISQANRLLELSDKCSAALEKFVQAHKSAYTSLLSTFFELEKARSKAMDIFEDYGVYDKDYLDETLGLNPDWTQIRKGLKENKGFAYVVIRDIDNEGSWDDR